MTNYETVSYTHLQKPDPGNDITANQEDQRYNEELHLSGYFLSFPDFSKSVGRSVGVGWPCRDDGEHDYNPVEHGDNGRQIRLADAEDRCIVDHLWKKRHYDAGSQKECRDRKQAD